MACELTVLTTTSLCFPALGRTHILSDPSLNLTLRARIGASSPGDCFLVAPLQVSGTAMGSGYDHYVVRITGIDVLSAEDSLMPHTA